VLEEAQTWIQLQIRSLREAILIRMLQLKTNPNRQHVSGPPSSAKYVEALKIESTTRGIPTWSGPWLATPYPFGIAGSTGDNGTNFPIYECVCVEFDVADLTGPI